MTTIELAKKLARDVDGLCLPDGRVVGTAGHDRARDFLLTRITDLGLEPYAGEYQLTYTVGDMHGTNLVACRPGRDRKLPPLLLGAHYDSVIPAPCADDNAAAVAILLALAELVSAPQPERDIVFTFFDAEEPPNYLLQTMGSIRFWSDQMDERGVHAAVVLDLVGHDLPVELLLPPDLGIPDLDRLRDLVFLTGADSHQNFQQVLRLPRSEDHLGLVAVPERFVQDMSDYAVFRWNNVPYLFFSCGRWEHYHQPSDTPDRLNYMKMARLTFFLKDLAQHLVAADLEYEKPGASDQSLVGRFPSKADTTGLEIELFQKAMGPLGMSVLGGMVGIDDVKSREDLDAIIRFLLAAGL